MKGQWVPRLWLVILGLCVGQMAWADSAEEHLAAFIRHDLAGDGFDRLGPFIEAVDGKEGCGCSSSGNHFDIAGDPVLVADDWKIAASRHPSPERAVIAVRFHLLADSPMGGESFAQGAFRRLHILYPARWLTRRYRLEKQFDGAWAVLADQTPVVAPNALAEAMGKALAGASRASAQRLSYYRREAATAARLTMLHSTHKVLAD